MLDQLLVGDMVLEMMSMMTSQLLARDRVFDIYLIAKITQNKFMTAMKERLHSVDVWPIMKTLHS